jgi:hypothetical protein
MAVTQLEKLIRELDPYKADVTIVPDTEPVEGDSTVDWVPDGEHPDVAWVPAAIPATETTPKKTVRLPLPSAGKGLESNEDGVFDLRYDTETLEVDGQGRLRVLPGRPMLSFVPAAISPLKPDFEHVFAVPKNTPVSMITYSGGIIRVPGKYRWIRVEGILTFTVDRHEESKWTYDCSFSVNGEAFEFQLDTTEKLSVIPCSVTVYNGDASETAPDKEISVSLKWKRAGEADLGVTCNAKVTVTAV